MSTVQCTTVQLDMHNDKKIVWTLQKPHSLESSVVWKKKINWFETPVFVVFGFFFWYSFAGLLKFYQTNEISSV